MGILAVKFDDFAYKHFERVHGLMSWIERHEEGVRQA